MEVLAIVVMVLVIQAKIAGVQVTVGEVLAMVMVMVCVLQQNLMTTHQETHVVLVLAPMDVSGIQIHAQHLAITLEKF